MMGLGMIDSGKRDPRIPGRHAQQDKKQNEFGLAVQSQQFLQRCRLERKETSCSIPTIDS